MSVQSLLAHRGTHRSGRRDVGQKPGEQCIVCPLWCARSLGKGWQDPRGTPSCGRLPDYYCSRNSGPLCCVTRYRITIHASAKKTTSVATRLADLGFFQFNQTTITSCASNYQHRLEGRASSSAIKMVNSQHCPPGLLPARRSYSIH